MSAATIKAQLAAQVATLSPPYVASTVQDAIALALYNALQKGETAGTAAAVGEIGQIQRIERVLSAQTALTSPNALNVAQTTTSLTLTTGHYQISGGVGFQGTGGGATVTRLEGAVSATTAAVPGGDALAVPTANGEYRCQTNMAAYALGVGNIVLPFTAYDIEVPAATTRQLWLVAAATFTGTLAVYGFLQIRRER